MRVINTQEWYCFCVVTVLTNAADCVQYKSVDHLSGSKTVKAREGMLCHMIGIVSHCP
jgi:hypothetical protein